MVLLSKLNVSKNLFSVRNLISTFPNQNAATAILNTNQLPVNSKIKKLENEWKNNPRWSDVKRNYNAEDVLKLQTSIKIDYSLAKYGANRLWKLLNKKEEYVIALGALTGNQAVQQVRAGLKAIYLSGWQVAADGNLSGDMYPDLSLYPSNSVPNVVRNVNKALTRADQIDNLEGKNNYDWFVPIVADAEAGFGGVLNAYELMKSMIEAGASGVHFEDQLTSAKKCGHMSGKVLVPTCEAINKLQAARLASDVLETPTIIIARTDAQSANLLTSDIDPNDKKFIISNERSCEGFFKTDAGLDQSISRGIAYAPYADLIWCETSTPDLEFAKKFAEAIQKEYPNKMLAYNCSPSFNWKLNLNQQTIAKFQKELNSMGYKFQFITLAGFHTLNYSMFNLAYNYAREGMAAFVKLQQNEFKASEKGFTAFKHQHEVGTSYFDEIISLVQERKSSTLALKGSTEEKQFFVNDLIKEQNITT